MLPLILILVALVLFALATFSVPTRFNLVAAGLFCWLLATSLGLFHL
jgi:hypothetical protein